MKKTKHLVIRFLLLLSSIHCSQAQTVIGFWEVMKVTVGDQIMTPQAKWTKIDQNGTYTSGNGWLQNAEGTWSYEKETNLFFPAAINAFDDPFGAFKVSFDGYERMYWEREEEGDTVIVSLIRIEKMPKSVADQIVGLWGLTNHGKDTDFKSEFSAEQHIFIRWDRIYVEQAESRLTGYWHINRHRPEVTFIYHQSDRAVETWTVTLSDTTLKLTGISDSNQGIIRSYTRLSEFPN